MIPKKIHYCWFGDKPLTDEVKFYIETWRKYCPDYEIIEWNESNFDVSINCYCYEAYKAKKWAFVADYVRLKVIYEYGGIYLDTDVEVCKNLDSILQYKAVFGYESEKYISTGTFAACRKNEWIGKLLGKYEDRHFKKTNGKYDLTTNVVIITEATKKIYNLNLDGKEKKIGDNIILLPFDYLCAKSLVTGKVMRTENTYTIHHFSGSWLKENEKKIIQKSREYQKKMDLMPFLLFRMKIANILAVLQVEGIAGVLERIKRKITNG